MSEEGKRLEIDPVLLEVMQNSITAGVNEGIRRALIDIDNMKEEKKKYKADMRFRNTELLLRNYQNFVQHTENSVYTESQLLNKSLFDELDLDMNEEITTTQVNSIIKSKNKTRIILKHINTFLDYYKYRCENSTREDIQRRYKVIEMLYLSDVEKITQEDVADFLHCSVRTIRDTKNVAIKELSVLFFGIDGLKMR